MTTDSNATPSTYPQPSEPGFYWRRVLHGGDTQDGSGWRWAVAEVYRFYGDDDGPLMTNGYEVEGSCVVWGPRCEPPPELPREAAQP